MSEENGCCLISNRHVAALSAAALTILALVGFSASVSAYSGPLMVSGIVCEGSTSNPIEDATVLIEVLDSGDGVLVWKQVTSGSTGLYMYFWSDVPSGSTKVRVTATIAGGFSKEETQSIPVGGDVEQDIVFPYGIPQIGGMIGVGVAAAALGAVAVVSLRRKQSLQFQRT